MPKNQGVIDFKPKNDLIFDYKPKNQIILDYKPKNEMSGEINRLYEVILGAGMLIGFGPAITYTQAITVLNPKSS